MFAKLATGLVLAASLAATAANAAQLRFSSFGPPVAFLTKNVFPEWGRRVAEATNGEVTVKMFPGGTLVQRKSMRLNTFEMCSVSTLLDYRSCHAPASV